MNKNIIVIAASPRLNGNSDTLADQFIKGAKASGHNIEKISLINKNIQFCKGCLVCQHDKTCVIKDDANFIVEKIKNADVVVFATPVYFYQMCGQMKTLIDRTNPLFFQDYQFRDIYLIATCADKEKSSLDGTTKGLQGWIDCFEKTKLKGIIRGLGIDQYGDVKNHQSVLQEAFLLGKNIGK